MYIAVLVTLLVAFAILAWRDLKFALTLLLALLPTYLLRFAVVIPGTLLEGFILVTFAIWLWKTYGAGIQARPVEPPLRQLLGPYAGPFIALLTLALVAVLWSPDKLAALGIWRAYYLEPLMVFVMLRSTFVNKSDWQRGLLALAVSISALSAWALVQKLTGLGIPMPWDLERRVTSVFEYPNALGLLVAPIVSALVVIFAKRSFVEVGLTFDGVRPTPTSIAMSMAIILGLIGIILAKTEAALVAIPAALMAVWWIANGAGRRPARTIVVATGIVAIVIAALTINPIRDKLLLQDYSGQVRLSQWQETLELLKDRPWLGAGLSGYPTAIKPYHDPRLYEIYQYPHNLILNLWVELGILGLIVGCWLMVAIIKQTWRHRHEPLVLAAFAALLTMMIHGLVDVPFFKNDLAVLTVFFLGMTATKERVDGL